ncbi:MAG: ATP-binding protein [Cyclobacteriaceae bacterium]
MERVIEKSRKKTAAVSGLFERYLIKKVSWEDRLIAIEGARGSGKTTLLLQYLSNYLPLEVSLYISMDDLFFLNNSLYEFADTFQKTGGKHLLIDEVHKYPDWSRELKLIYDDFPDLQVVFTSSSILEIHKGESDLSRRAVSYTLKELSLREYVTLSQKVAFPSYSFTDVLTNHVALATSISQQIKPLKVFNEYLKYGAYPYFTESIDTYEQKLISTLNLILDVDLKAVENPKYAMIVKLKKLLYVISTSVPFTPNITKLSERTGISRNTLLLALKHLERARLIHSLNKPTKGLSALAKPDKVYLNNTNLMYGLAQGELSKGTLRETFFLNQLTDFHSLHLPPQGDFLVDNTYTVEIGGKQKGKHQIKEVQQAYIAKDGIEIGNKNTIPLWLFGFLY